MSVAEYMGMEPAIALGIWKPSSVYSYEVMHKCGVLKITKIKCLIKFEVNEIKVTTNVIKI